MAFLTLELDRAATDEMAVIVASHHSARDLLTSYPNAILHVVGHTHRNRVMAICPE